MILRVCLHSLLSAHLGKDAMQFVIQAGASGSRVSATINAKLNLQKSMSDQPSRGQNSLFKQRNCICLLVECDGSYRAKQMKGQEEGISTWDYYFEHRKSELEGQCNYLLQPDKAVKGTRESHRLFTKQRQNPGLLTQPHHTVSWVFAEAQLSAE